MLIIISIITFLVNPNEKMMIPHLKEDKSEWEFYDKLVKEWNLKYDGKKSLSEFLKFMLDKVKLFPKVL